MEIRPSNLHRRERCPGSARMEEGKIDQVSERAERGTALHAIVKKGIIKPNDRQKLMIEADDGIEFVCACWDHADEIWSSLSPEQRSRAKVLVEHEVDLSFFGMEKGTLDFGIIVFPTETESGLLFVRDWKSGFSWVPQAKGNLQILIYTAALVIELKFAGSVNIGILQPEIRDFADIHICHTSDLTILSERLNRIVEKCNAENAMLIPGAWCEYCKASMSCEKRMAVAVEIKQIINPVQAIMEMEGEARKNTWERLKEAVKILCEAKDTIMEAVKSGQIDIPGYSLGAGRKSRYWCAEPKTVIDSLMSAAAGKGLEVKDFLEPIGVTKAEKLFGESAISGLYAEKVGEPILRRSKQ